MYLYHIRVDVIRPVAVQHFIITPSHCNLLFFGTCTKVKHQQVFFITAIIVSVLHIDHMFTLTNISRDGKREESSRVY